MITRGINRIIVRNIVQSIVGGTGQVIVLFGLAGGDEVNLIGGDGINLIGGDQ